MIKILICVWFCYFFILRTNANGINIIHDDNENEALINHFINEDLMLPNNTNKVQRMKRRSSTIEKTSLVIVFDATASMGDDLVQMRSGAIYLVNKFSERTENPIINYILVVFMDPAIIPTFVTEDKIEIINRLNSVVLNSSGNIDCPELSISGLINGLTAAKHKPFVFLFTDAGAKDAYREEEVVKLIQQKQPTIIILHTNDDCSRDINIHPLYNKLAQISNGEVYRLGREDISSVIKNLDKYIDPRLQIVSYETHPPGNHTKQFDVDGTMDELTFSISGAKPWLKIFDPNHIEYNNFTKLIALENVQTFLIQNPTIGKWSLSAGSTSTHSLKLTTISSVHFSYGFSVEVPESILNTAYLPLAGLQNILSIWVSNATMVRTIETARIISPSQKFDLPLKKTQNGNEELYLTEKFTLPTQPFKIFIIGRDNNNEILERLLTPALKTTRGENPETNLPFNKIDASENQATSLLCHVVSLMPVKIQWVKESTGDIIAQLNASQGKLLNHTLSNLKITDSGTYVCIAENSIGKSETKTVLHVRAIPLTILTPKKSVTAIEGEKVILKCVSSPKDNVDIKWLHNGNSLFPATDIHFQLPNIILINVKRTMSGEYTCIGTKRDGETKRDTIVLTIQYPPRIVEQPTETIILPYGTRYIITCSSDGQPIPTKSWTLKTRIGSKTITNLESIDIKSMNANDEGIYTCEIKNSIGLPAYRKVTLKAKASVVPTVIKPYNVVINAKIGSFVELQCKCHNCGPVLKHQWNKDSLKLLDKTDENHENFLVKISEEIIKSGNNFIKQDEYNLKISHIKENQGGIYNCILSNEFGSDHVRYVIQILKPPKITSTFLPEIKVIPPNPVTISCNAIGFPTPEVFWVKDEKIVSTNHLLQLEPNNMSLAGQYYCTGTNSEGQDSRNVDIYPIVKPTFDNLTYTQDVYEGMINTGLYITCPFNGEDEVIWKKDNKIISKEKKLKILSLQRNMHGTIFCIATNLAGSVEHKFDINVTFPPTNLRTNSWYKKYEQINTDGIIEVSLALGQDFEVDCLAEGNPKPKFFWKKKTEIISINEQLFISEVKIENDDIYICEAKNDIGKAILSYRLIVIAAPQIDERFMLEDLNDDIIKSCETPSPILSALVSADYMKADYVKTLIINSGEELRLNCKINANPPPNIIWFKNGNKLDVNSKILTIRTALSQNTGFYKCISQNAYGKLDILFKVEVKEKPILDTPQKIKVIEGKELKLKCTAKGNTIPLLTWELRGSIKVTGARKELICKNSKKFFNENKLYINLKGLRVAYDVALRSKVYGILSYRNDLNEVSLEMIIPKVKINDRGNYSCVGINSVTRVTRQVAVLILVPPSFNKALFNDNNVVQIIKKFKITLKCPMMGEPEPKILWFKDNFPVYANSETKIDSNGRVLGILNSREEHSGIYECRAVNEAGNSTMKFHVTIEAPFEIDTSNDHTRYNLNENLDVVEGQNLTLTCPTGGSLRVLSTWSKLLYHYGRETLVKSKSIFLENIKESAAYVCSITNTKFVIEKTFYVNVKKPPKFYTNEITKTINVNIMKQFDLDCSVEADPIPSVIWFKEGHIHDAWKNNFHDVADMQILYKKASLEDNGYYTCIVQNYLGTIERNFKVEIIAIPKWTPWGEWGDCNAECGDGISSKRRYCLLDNGELARSIGASCYGNDVLEKWCNIRPCPINGNWGEWTDFTECLLSCVTDNGEKSTKYRRRICDNPKPQYHGSYCVGSDEEIHECLVPHCPVNGVWSEFSDWSPCSTTCGAGKKTRTRICIEAKHGGKDCEGNSMEINNCHIRNCPDELAAKEQKPPIAKGVCDKGYVYSAAQQNCQDINECRQKNVCHNTQKCINTPGSFICRCLPGFETKSLMNYAKCYDINECSKNIHGCEDYCQNEKGSYYCLCRHGYILHEDGKSCIQIRRKRNIFEDEPVKCSLGYKKINETCIDINECEQKTSCNENETCLNIKGSFLCFPTSCPEYFIKNERTCIQICREVPSKNCMDEVKIGQVIQYEMLSLTETLPDEPILEITAYSDTNYNSTTRIIFSFDNLIDKSKFTMIKNLIKKDTMNLYVHENITSNQIHTLELTVKTFDTTGINLLYLTNYFIYIFIS